MQVKFLILILLQINMFSQNQGNNDPSLNSQDRDNQIKQLKEFVQKYKFSNEDLSQLFSLAKQMEGTVNEALDKKKQKDESNEKKGRFNASTNQDKNQIQKQEDKNQNSNRKQETREELVQRVLRERRLNKQISEDKEKSQNGKQEKDEKIQQIKSDRKRLLEDQKIRGNSDSHISEKGNLQRTKTQENDSQTNEDQKQQREDNQSTHQQNEDKNQQSVQEQAKNTDDEYTKKLQRLIMKRRLQNSQNLMLKEHLLKRRLENDSSDFELNEEQKEKLNKKFEDDKIIISLRDQIFKREKTLEDKFRDQLIEQYEVQSQANDQYEQRNLRQEDDRSKELKSLKRQLAIVQRELEDYQKEAQLYADVQTGEKDNAYMQALDNKSNNLQQGENLQSQQIETKSTNNVQGNASATSAGNGTTAAAAGPKGTSSSASGTLGTTVGTNFKNNSTNSSNSWGFKSDSFGNKLKFGNTSTSNSNMDTSSTGGSTGEGQAQSQSTTDGSLTMAQGKEGSFSGNTFKGSSNSSNKQWADQKNSDGESQVFNNISNNTANNSSSTYAQGQGESQTGAQSTGNGSQVKATGSESSQVDTQFSGNSTSNSAKQQQTNTKNGTSYMESVDQNKEYSEGGVNAYAEGNGNIEGYSDRQNGSQVKASGDEATTSNATWNGDNDSNSSSFSFENWFDQQINQ